MSVEKNRLNEIFQFLIVLSFNQTKALVAPRAFVISFVKGALISYLKRERYLLGLWSDSSQSLKVEREYGLHEAEG